MTKPVTIRPQLICFSPKSLIKELDICWAAPLAATNFPNMAPKTIMVTKEPSVSPKPFCMDFAKSGKGNPNSMPLNKLTNKKAMNEFTFK